MLARSVRSGQSQLAVGLSRIVVLQKEPRHIRRLALGDAAQRTVLFGHFGRIVQIATAPTDVRPQPENSGQGQQTQVLGVRSHRLIILGIVLPPAVFPASYSGAGGRGSVPL